MDQERERVQADLRGLLDGEVRCDDLFVRMYASDASIYEIRPLGVVRPQHTADVVACVKYAAENEIPIHARGAGTGVAGESLGPGLILDFSHSMRRILAARDDTVRVQPGVVHASLNRHLAAIGRLFGPDPATRSVTTMGSVLALDAGGSHWPKFGSARSRVVSMQVVLADGEVIEADTVTLPEPPAAPSDRRAELALRLSDVIERHRDLIAAQRPKSLVNRSGYHVYDVLQGRQLDLARLLVGSEGTLALITEATVRTDPIARARGVVLLYFERLDFAAIAAQSMGALQISACDLLDRRLLSISREVDPRFDALIPKAAEAALLVELQGDDPVEVRERMNSVVQRIQRRRRLAFDYRMTMDRQERNLFWSLSRRTVPRLYRLKGSIRPLPFVEDMAIPPEHLPEFLTTVQNVLKSHQVTATLFAHAAHGQLHIRPFLDLANADDVGKLQELAAALYEETLKVGGTISGEHGEGLSRTWYAQRQHGPLNDVFRAVKRIFDPANILNPGKVVAEVPQPPTKNLRSVTAAAAPPTAGNDAAANRSVAAEVRLFQPKQLQLYWPEQDMTPATRLCNGCGRCRTTSADERMCPIFRFAPREEASPRAKANLLRGILTGQLDAQLLSTDAFKSIADLCVNCHQCRLECPANVDIPKLMIEAKAQYVSVNGLRLGEWIWARLDVTLRWAATFRSLTNWAISNRTARWLLERTLGIARRRKLPRLAPRTFLAVAQRRRLSRQARGGGRKVLYFVDTYANWFDVPLAEACVDILQHNGVAVYVPPQQGISGMSALSMGAVDLARRCAARNVPLLADAVRQGYHIVTTEPSAALFFQRDLLSLIDDADARLVAANVSEACGYLWRLHQTGQLELDLKPLNYEVGYHLPCHQRALESGSPAEQLLRLIPGLALRRIERGCSGMAGTFGLRRRNFRSSLRAGWGLISAIREPTVQIGAAECSSCKMQMEQGTSKPTLHPLKLLALSYGLRPEFEDLLTAQGEELVLS